jgi:hypothetical protein
VAGKVLRTNLCPNNVWQAWAWFHAFLPFGDTYFMIGIAAICWAIWKTRNKVTFDKHRMRNTCEVSLLASSLLMYWAGLQKEQGARANSVRSIKDDGDGSYIDAGSKTQERAVAELACKRWVQMNPLNL